jgi:hypothetical protein
MYPISEVMTPTWIFDPHPIYFTVNSTLASAVFPTRSAATTRSVCSPVFAAQMIPYGAASASPHPYETNGSISAT